MNTYSLINMNGRMYDPIVGRFLSVDPYVSDATHAGSYNRYSYALNNPMKYTDPSGYLPKTEYRQWRRWLRSITIHNDVENSNVSDYNWGGSIGITLGSSGYYDDSYDDYVLGGAGISVYDNYTNPNLSAYYTRSNYYNRLDWYSNAGSSLMSGAIAGLGGTWYNPKTWTYTCTFTNDAPLLAYNKKYIQRSNYVKLEGDSHILHILLAAGIATLSKTGSTIADATIGYSSDKILLDDIEVRERLVTTVINQIQWTGTITYNLLSNDIIKTESTGFVDNGGVVYSTVHEYEIYNKSTNKVYFYSIQEVMQHLFPNIIFLNTK